MEKENTNYLIPGSIIIAGIIIAGTIFYTNEGGSITRSVSEGDGERQTASIGDFRPISNEDHIRGNPDAPITVVEFSDFECPFCERFHPTMTRVIEEFDDVKWVYRHFPLTSIHSRAQDAAVASECVAKLSGNDAFWTFADAIFDNQERLGDDLYGEIVKDLGISAEAFDSCFSSKEALDQVNADLNEAIASGGRGTPFSIVITPSGEFFPFSGALAYEQVVAIINQVREQ